MKNLAWMIAVLAFGFGVSGCSTNPMMQKKSSDMSMQTQTTNKEEMVASSGGSILGGNISKSMDENDQSKISHALDKPLGKSTQWVNENTGISYTVTPTKKLALNGNPYCRSYTVVASMHDVKNQTSGTACVSATDSSWQVVN